MPLDVWQYRIRCIEDLQDFFVDLPSGSPAPTACPLHPTHSVSVTLQGRHIPDTDYTAGLPVPGPGDDETANWRRGSRILAVDGVVYECLDESVGAAVWEQRGQGGGGGAIIVQEEGVAVPGGPHTTLDFKGVSVTASDAGGGVAAIDVVPIAGSERVDAASEGVSATTSTTPVTKVSLNTGLVPAGDYEIFWYCERRYSNQGIDWLGMIRRDGATVISRINAESKDASNWLPWSGMFRETLAVGAYGYTIEYGRESAPGVARIRRARLLFQRVK